ncbi:tRNA (5-methylaminomethyl-2-thiouridine)(34)-methyltransferase MnmD [Rhodobacteraceae bacterium nBUS_24]
MPSFDPQLSWRDRDVPVSTQFDDPYYSLENGLQETQHVFLAGNDLPQRFCDGFHIAELGFGTGLNLLATLALWRASGATGQLLFTSFEAYPLTADQMIRALAHFTPLETLAKEFAPLWAELCAHSRIETDELCLNLHIGDARETLPNWQGQANCWFLDGFSPAKNPQLWESELLKAVYEHTCDGGSAATYTAAGFVRRNLETAGFTVKRSPGFGRKRHMTHAVKGDFNAEQ